MSDIKAKHCWVCKRYITSLQWEPFCCQVCYDSHLGQERCLLVRLQGKPRDV